MTGLEASETPDPFAWFDKWYAEAEAEGSLCRDAMALATADRCGMPSLRYVFFRGFHKGGLVFYSNYRSRKGRELASNPHASAAFFWPGSRRQVRIEGTVERVGRAMSQRYFADRSKPSQIGAWASRQSEEIADRNELFEKIAHFQDQFGQGPVPLPVWWGGYRLIPHRFEFWKGAEHRRHHRHGFEKRAEGWRAFLLAP